MKQLPLNIQDAIDRYEPVTAEGLTLYPVRVRDARAFGFARSVLDFAVTGLPVALISMPLLDAFYRLDQKSYQETGEAAGYVSAAILCLALSLRLEAAHDTKLLMLNTRIVPDEQRSGRIREIVFNTGEGPLKVTPRQFQKIRPILAAQNGVEMPSDSANPEILKMERLMAEKELKDLDPKLCDKIIFCSAWSGIPEEQIYDWPILKLERRAAVLRRTLDYLAVSTGMMSGLAKFPDGNPVPSPYWAKKVTGIRSLRDLSSEGAAAESTVANGQQQVKE